MTDYSRWNFAPIGGGMTGAQMQDRMLASLQKKPNDLAQQAQKAGAFADWSEGNVQGLSAEALAQRDALRRLASGQDSYSAEQLRQNLGQNLAAQQSMAAGARPGNSAMAALNASQNAMRLGSGLAGQQSLAGIAERQAAQKALSDMILGERGQDVQGALGSRGNAIQGYIGKNQQDNQPSGLMRVLGGIAPIVGALSDKRAKKNIKKGAGDAKRALDSLKAYTYDYKDEKHGKGRQFGVMAQDLEKAGLKHAVRETPIGKVVDGGKLSLSNTAMLAELGRRVGKLEGGKKGRK
jgi:hypothetical protein